jgi:hypothetical protein
MNQTIILVLKKLLLAGLALSCDLAIAQEHGVSVAISPSGLFTLVAPYPGVVEAISPAGKIVDPLPSEWPVGILDRGLNALEPERAKYIALAMKFSLARITPFPHHDNAKSLDARFDAFNKEFTRYGLKRSSGNNPPWLLFSSSLNQRRFMESFYAQYMNTNSFPERLNRVTDSKEALVVAHSTGIFPDEIEKTANTVKKRGNFFLSQPDKHMALVKVLKWVTRDDLPNKYLIRRDPYTAESFEPNNTDLVSPDGKINIVVGRGAGQSSQLPAVERSVDNLRTYWVEAVAQDVLDDNDISFLNNILMLKKMETTDVNRLTIARTIVDEATKAQQTIARGYALGTLIHFASSEINGPDLATIVASLKKHAYPFFASMKISDQELTDSARGMVLAVGPTFNPRPDVPFPPPLPAYDSIERIANELRPTQHYEGSLLNVSEREGLIRFQEDKRWFQYNLNLWTVEVPLGGGVDNSTFSSVANFRAFRPPEYRYSDLEELFNAEVGTALALSPTFFSVSRMISFDSIASALREFEYRKVDTGRTISSIAKRIRDQMAALSDLIAQKDKDEQGGFFFPPYKSLVVSSRVKIGDKVKSGTSIAVVRPLHQYRVDISIPLDKLDPQLFVGSTIKFRLACPNSIPLPSSVGRSHSGLPTLKKIFDRALSSTNLSVEIMSLEPTISGTQIVYHASGYLNTPPELNEINHNELAELGTLAPLVTSKNKRAIRLTPPFGLLPAYSFCTAEL